MTIYLDTSALVAVLDADDEHHDEAVRVWHDLLASGETLVTSNYVLLETVALAQRRLGIGAVRALARDVTPILTVAWVGEEDHRAGVTALLAARRRRLSLVDCVSFELMTRLGIARCFAFDPHFREHGFACDP